MIFEDGRQSRDFIHVSDITAGIEAALDPAKADGFAVNLGTGRSVSVLDVAAVLSAGLGVELEPEILGDYRAGDIRHCFGSIDRARDLLAFQPKVVFEDGMRELSGWLAGQTAVDRVDEATAALRSRGLAR
jgi:dTDP-L-rhamnose 4-epimerase